MLLNNVQKYFQVKVFTLKNFRFQINWVKFFSYFIYFLWSFLSKASFADVPSFLTFDQDNLQRIIRIPKAIDCNFLLDDDLNFKVANSSGGTLIVTARPINERPTNLLIECKNAQYFVTLKYENASRFSSNSTDFFDDTPRAYLSTRFEKPGGESWQNETRFVDGSFSPFQFYGLHRQESFKELSRQTDSLDLISQGGAWNGLVGAGYSRRRERELKSQFGVLSSSDWIHTKRAQIGLLGVYGSISEERKGGDWQTRRSFVGLPAPFDFSWEGLASRSQNERSNKFEKQFRYLGDRFYTEGFLRYSLEKRLDTVDSEKKWDSELRQSWDLFEEWSLGLLQRSGCLKDLCYLDEIALGPQYWTLKNRIELSYAPIPNALSLSGSVSFWDRNQFKWDLRKQFDPINRLSSVRWTRKFPEQDFQKFCSADFSFVQTQNFENSKGRWELFAGVPLCTEELKKGSYADLGYVWRKNLWSLENHFGVFGSISKWNYWVQLSRYFDENLSYWASASENHILAGTLKSVHESEDLSGTEIQLLEATTSNILKTTLTEANGGFLFNNIPPAGKFKVQAKRLGRFYERSVTKAIDKSRLVTDIFMDDFQKYRIIFVNSENRELSLNNEVPEIRDFILKSNQLGVRLQKNDLLLPRDLSEVALEMLVVNNALLPVSLGFERVEIIDQKILRVHLLNAKRVP